MKLNMRDIGIHSLVRSEALKIMGAGETILFAGNGYRFLYILIDWIGNGKSDYVGQQWSISNIMPSRNRSSTINVA